MNQVFFPFLTSSSNYSTKQTNNHANKQLILFHIVLFDLGRVLHLRNQGEVMNQTLRIAVLTGTLPAGMYEL